MAKLPRVTAKVFASNAPQDKIGQFGSAKAGTKVNTSDISTIQGLPAFSTGWTEAVVQGQNYPTLEEMNGLQKVFSQQIAYLFEQGIPEYDSNTTYYVGSVCKVATANSLTFYVSKVDNNVGNVITNTSFWLAFPMYSKNEVISFGLPDYTSGVNVTTPYVNNKYTAPYNGVLVLCGARDSDGGEDMRANINGVQTAFSWGERGVSGNSYSTNYIPLKQGDVIYCHLRDQQTSTKTFSNVWSCVFYKLGV